VKGLLQNSEKAKRNVWRQTAPQIVCVNVNLHILLFAELPAEASHSSRYAEILQL